MKAISPDKNRGLILLTLSCVPGIGPARINAIISHFGCSSVLFDASASDFLLVPGIGNALARQIANFLHHREKRSRAEQSALEQMEQIERCGGKLVTIIDTDYPALLKEIYDPPPCLFVRGTLPDPELPAIAIVGTRHATAYGKQAAGEFSRKLAVQGFQIVSGLAYGIDSAAHEAAIQSGGKTVAVLASGVDTVYTDPKGRIWPKIIEQGALISEEWFGSELLPGKFPKRNRIISGMTKGTLVVESDLKGGALITASYALEQNREVFAVPGNIYSRSSRGTNRLIQTGEAKAVLDVEDILVEFSCTSCNSTRSVPEKNMQLSVEEKQLLTALGEEPVHLDMLAQKTGFDIGVLLVLLFELELKKAVIQLPGQFFRKTF